jgi:alpha-L-rhamnosidase
MKRFFLFSILRNTLYLLIFYIGLNTGSAFAQTIHPEVLNKVWDAIWISQGDQPNQEYGVYHFRKAFELKEKPDSFIIHVSGDNRYKLFVNGKWVSHGPARCDLYHWNFETVDIAAYLQSGPNVIGATVWNFGSYRPENQISFRTAFILKGNTAAENIVNTNHSWKVKKDIAYSPLPVNIINTYYVVGPGEAVDLNKYSTGWGKAGYDDSGWENAAGWYAGIPKGIFTWSEGSWMLVPRSIPQMELKDEKPMVVRSSKIIKQNQEKDFTLPVDFPLLKKSLEISGNSKIRILLDQAYLTNAYPVLQFSKGKNSIISLSYAEALYVDEGDEKVWQQQVQKGNRNEIKGKRFVGTKDQIISNGMEHQLFSTLMFRTYRYLQLEIETKDEPLLLERLSGVFTGYPFKQASSFNAQNAEMDKILEVGWRTARLCAGETYTDCPYYEQLQYAGDTRIQSLVTMFNSGDDRLVRNAIEQLNNSRMPEGITLSRFPSAHAQQIPAFSLWWIGMVHDYWMYRNDEQFVRDMLPGIRQVLNWFKKFQGADRTLKHVAYWNFTDWVEGENAKGWSKGIAPVGDDGRSSVMDLQLLWAYQLAARMEKALGIKELGSDYESECQKITESIRNLYWDDSGKAFAETTNKKTFSQHVNALAILTNVVKGEEAHDLADKLMQDKNLVAATIYFKYYVHQALAKGGYGEKYIHLLSDWNAQLANGLTTWAEISDWNKSRSDCHAWGASPNIEFFRIVLGIDSDAPGFSDIKIQPAIGELKNISGKIPHPLGEITVEIKTEKQGQKAEVFIPSGTTGRFIWKGKIMELKPGERTVLKLW